METFTLIHVVISFLGIFSGFAVVAGLLVAKPLARTTVVFLTSTVATSVTGFFFPFHGLTPAHVVGVISLILLAAAIYALYAKRLSGSWRGIYIVTAVFSLYLNFFVLIVQSFEKVPALHALAPTQSEPPFAIAQALALILFLVLGILSLRRPRFVPAAI